MINTTVTIHCDQDGCEAEYRFAFSVTRGQAFKDAAAHGWGHVGILDFCPKCTSRLTKIGLAAIAKAKEAANGTG